MTSSETVVLLADDGTRTGTADKATVHTATTPLHLAFSCHLLGDDGRVLVTRRALAKRTWPGVWTNSVCGHPGPDESFEDAILRRSRFELGVEVADVEVVVPDFRYRAVDASGVVENEICPVFTARALSPVRPNPDEVMDLAWVTPAQLRDAVRAMPFALSPWLVQHAAGLPLLAEVGA
ncbi:isopentenyl-diphosphate Delta-isomerase [Cellulomonas carbonis]|uniref:Isopentenyl-diphosphate Delta-isomerase n=1 Tax=Cellulomonas carbonis T26 TaxID=947969 RepID=A0A0A0BMC4_9CELL|nr:isopentenyl-diphosphate Delta-isomerase [Cellulomonas carbonis]KGM09653.1 isopentenyl-diphosphate delta-isomerase [Cellulomonas carbonis T26]GGC07017.1 isopentenyl-diphosphate Delta-isomerase [Cellulomonas carbonis]